MKKTILMIMMLLSVACFGQNAQTVEVEEIKCGYGINAIACYNVYSNGSGSYYFEIVAKSVGNYVYYQVIYSTIGNSKVTRLIKSFETKSEAISGFVKYIYGENTKFVYK